MPHSYALRIPGNEVFPGIGVAVCTGVNAFAGLVPRFGVSLSLGD